MSKVKIRHSNAPEIEVKRILREQMAQVTPKASLEEIVRKLEAFENRFGMSTVQFYSQFLAGKMGDSAEVMAWASAYETYTYLIETYSAAKAAGS